MGHRPRSGASTVPPVSCLQFVQTPRRGSWMLLGKFLGAGRGWQARQAARSGPIPHSQSPLQR